MVPVTFRRYVLMIVLLVVAGPADNDLLKKRSCYCCCVCLSNLMLMEIEEGNSTHPFPLYSPENVTSACRPYDGIRTVLPKPKFFTGSKDQNSLAKGMTILKLHYKY